MPMPAQKSTSVSADQFLQALAESALLPAGEVQSLRTRITPALRQDCRPLIQELVKTQKLTKFQATALFHGKGRELVLDNYAILDKIGEGGMGMVYKARHRKLGQVVALKVLSPAVTSKPTAVKRFLREVRAVSQLRHPNIVAASDAGEDKGTHFLVMEYVEGTDLAKRVKQSGPLPISQACDYIQQAALGLQHAHEQGLIHRDIKPSNLLVSNPGPKATGLAGIVKILDLGLARRAGDDDDSATQELTQTGTILGTCDFMAPEQALNSKNADQRSDIYSLGCTLYYLVAGKPLFGGQTSMEKLLAHRETPIPPLPAASPELQAVYQRMVAKKPEDRFPSMSETIAALEACQRPGAAKVRPVAARRRPIVIGTAAGVIVAAGLLLVLLGPATRQPGEAGKATPAADAAKPVLPQDTTWKPPVAGSDVDDPARWRNAINLLPLIDPARDALGGKWAATPGGLSSDGSPAAKLLLPYLPPQEYDVRLEFTQNSGKDGVLLALSRSGRVFGWHMGAYGNTISGFSNIDGKALSSNSTMVRRGLENGERYTCVVQVRNQGVKAFVNGKFVSEYNGADKALSSPEFWQWPADTGLGVGSWASAATFHRIEVLAVAGKGKVTKQVDPGSKDPGPKSAVDDPARWQNAINLLPLIEFGKDAASGKWQKNDFGLGSAKTSVAKLVIPYQPPEEYDFRITFTRHEGDHSVAQVLSKGGRCFAWEMGLFPNQACGFNMVASMGGNHKNNPTTVLGKELTNGKRHTSIVQVRNSGLTTYLDGGLVKDYKTDYKDMGQPYPWNWPTPSCLGVGSWTSATTFHSIEVLEVTGKGTRTRP